MDAPIDEPSKPQTKAVRTWRYFLPLAIFVGLLALFWRGLELDPRAIPSALLNRPAPAFALPQLHHPEKVWATQDMRGKVWVLNVWGSWCGSCRYEHPALLDMAKQLDIAIIGLNWKDRPDEARAWLARYGDPYRLSVSDADGRVAIDYGVYGAPETYIIDKAGVIRHKHTGPIDANIVRDTLVPIIRKLERA